MPYNDRVLVIDDDTEIQQIFRSVLGGISGNVGPARAELDILLNGMTGDRNENQCKSRSFQVDTASQGESGLRKVIRAREEGTPYAVVFVDMRMPPGWDGIRTTREIHQVDPEVQIVIVTAYSDASISEIVSQVGFTNRLLYLKKPFDEEEILQLADSLTMRWNLETKVKGFMQILESILATFSAINFAGDLQELKGFWLIFLEKLAVFLGTKDIFLARMEDEEIRFKVGLGKFENGITEEESFRKVLAMVSTKGKGNQVCHFGDYLVLPIVMRSCKNVVVGIVQEREVEDVDSLLKALAENAVMIFEQAARMAKMQKEIDALRAREQELTRELAGRQ